MIATINRTHILQWTFNRHKTIIGTHNGYRWIAWNWRQSETYPDCYAYDLIITSINSNKVLYRDTHHRRNMVYEGLERMNRIRIEQLDR